MGNIMNCCQNFVPYDVILIPQCFQIFFIVYLFFKLRGVHLFVKLGLASDLIVHDIFTWGMSWTLLIELGFVHLNFPGLLINEMTCFHW